MYILMYNGTPRYFSNDLAYIKNNMLKILKQTDLCMAEEEYASVTIDSLKQEELVIIEVEMDKIYPNGPFGCNENLIWGELYDNGYRD
jgi:hypothetical protein